MGDEGLQEGYTVCPDGEDIINVSPPDLVVGVAGRREVLVPGDP